MEASATIEFSLSSSKSLAREMPQWAELFLDKDETSLLCKFEKPKKTHMGEDTKWLVLRCKQMQEWYR